MLNILYRGHRRQSCVGNNVPGADFRVDDPHEKTRFAEFRPSLSLHPVASTHWAIGGFGTRQILHTCAGDLAGVADQGLVTDAEQQRGGE